MEGTVVTLQDVFVFKQTGIGPTGRVLGDLQPTGIRPKFADRLRMYGLTIGEDVFNIGRWG